MASDARIGQTFAGYQVESVLGRGGMAVVYLALDPRLGRRVAIKVLAGDLAEDQRFRERFIRESHTAAGLDHPNIVPVYEAGEYDGALFIAMRYVRGIDLKAMVRRDGPLSPERTLAILGQVGAALDTAHAEGLVHRDVKPANVLIAEATGPRGADHVYLSDFGVAKSATSLTGLTQTGQFVGTLDYVAPEQIEGSVIDARTDLYALAAMFVECVTGRPPYERDSSASLMYAHLLEPPPKVSLARPDLPAALDAVIATGMAKDSANRYGTAHDFVSAAAGALSARPEAAAAAATTGPGVSAGHSETVLHRQPPGVDTGATVATGLPGLPPPSGPPDAAAWRHPEAGRPGDVRNVNWAQRDLAPAVGRAAVAPPTTGAGHTRATPFDIPAGDPGRDGRRRGRQRGGAPVRGARRRRTLIGITGVVLLAGAGTGAAWASSGHTAAGLPTAGAIASTMPGASTVASAQASRAGATPPSTSGATAAPVSAGPTAYQLPPARGDFAIAVDPTSGRLLLTGGVNGAGVHFTDTWSWDGFTWSRVDSSSPAVSSPTMGADPITGRLLLIGLDSPGGATGAQTYQLVAWEWNGASWTKAPSANPPSSLITANLVNDTPRHQLLLDGMTAGPPSGPWVLTAAGWKQVGSSAPAAVFDAPAGAAVDPATGHVVQFGGSKAGPSTVVWDGTTWRVARSSGVPPSGPATAAADGAQKRIVLLAPPADNPALPTTWTWESGNWVRHVVQEPPAVGYHAMAWVPDARVTALVVSDGSTISMWSWTVGGWMRLAA